MTRPPVARSPFGTMPDGTAVELFTLSNSSGIELSAIGYGARIVSLLVPGREGRRADVVLGYDSLVGYLDDSHYLGAVAGRVANRIADARFTLDGTDVQLSANDGANHLHGGSRGFDRVMWSAEPFAAENGAGLMFRYTSPAGEEGYPGTLDAQVRYTLNDRNEVLIDYRATTDRSTPVNLTQHSSFNLAGAGNGSVLDHLLQVPADTMTPVGPNLIPTGEIIPVSGGPFDFRKPTRIGDRIGNDHEQLLQAGGYDHNLVLARKGPAPSPAARLMEPVSGRILEVSTTEPGLQVYSGNFLHPGVIGKAGRVYDRHGGICLETQHFPDAPNQPHFPSIILRPGSEYRSTTIYRFSTDR